MEPTTAMETAPPAAVGVVEESTTVGMVMQEPVHAAEKKPRMKVMVAVDESEGSFFALRWTLDHLVRRTSPAPPADDEEVEIITLVHVQQPFQHYAFPAGPGGAGFSLSLSRIDIN